MGFSGFNGVSVSVVTPLLNQASFVEETIESVKSQGYPALEHIVIDGGSKDGSLEILARHDDDLTWISESDDGQAAAINKGFEMATGDILCWLNADDLLAPGAVQRVVSLFQERPSAAFVYGDAEAIDARGRSYGRRVNVGPGSRRELVEDRDFVVQPAAFWRSRLWDEVGPLDERLRYVFDYELWMRIAARCELHYVPFVLARERLHSEAKTFEGGIRRAQELEEIATRHGGEGVPRAFRAEAGAGYLMSGLRGWTRARWRNGSADIRRGLKVSDSLIKTTVFMATTLLLGPGRVARARLWSNLVKSRFESAPKATAVSRSG